MVVGVFGPKISVTKIVSIDQIGCRVNTPFCHKEGSVPELIFEDDQLGHMRGL